MIPITGEGALKRSGGIVPRIDDYKKALELGREDVSGKDPNLIASVSGARMKTDKQGNRALGLGFLGREVVISWPALEFSYGDSDEACPIELQVLLVHYLRGAWSRSSSAITGEWVAFQDLPDGRFYLDAFVKRAKDPFVMALGSIPERLPQIAAKTYGADPYDYGDFSVVVRALPLVPVALILWAGDEEFPPDGNILFDRCISDIFSAEDVAWLAGMVVYPLIRMAN